MAQAWKCPDKEVLLRWINELHFSKKLKKAQPWEKFFIDSIDSQLVYKKILSRDQVEILERIYTEFT